MPDAMDAIQQFNDDHVSDSLQRHASRAREAGRTQCVDPNCGEPISAARQGMGAVRCLPCQRAHEAQAAHFTRWGGR